MCWHWCAKQACCWIWSQLRFSESTLPILLKNAPHLCELALVWPVQLSGCSGGAMPAALGAWLASSPLAHLGMVGVNMGDRFWLELSEMPYWEESLGCLHLQGHIHPYSTVPFLPFPPHFCLWSHPSTTSHQKEGSLLPQKQKQILRVSWKMKSGRRTKNGTVLIVDYEIADIF